MFPCLVQRGGGVNGRVLVAALVMLAGTATHAGTVTILSAEQSVSASIQGGDDERFDDRTSTAAAPFEAAAAVELVGDGFTYRAGSSLASTFGPDGLSFDFERAYETQDARGGVGPVKASVGFDVRVLFAIDAVYRASFLSSREDEAASTPGAGVDGDAFFALVGQDGTDFLALPGEGNLLLEPGTYAVRLTASRTSNGGGAEVESLFSPIRFDLSLAEAGDDTPPNPIPLPPAAASAAALLGVGGLSRFRRRRR